MKSEWMITLLTAGGILILCAAMIIWDKIRQRKWFLRHLKHCKKGTYRSIKTIIKDIMKKKIFLASLAMLAIVAIIVVSCNENEELDDFYSLDVTSRTPITKSSMADYEPGASQTIGGSTTSPYTVPENEDECMLYAIISIAASRHIPITYRESDGSGGYKKSTKTIGRKDSRPHKLTIM